MATQMVSVSDTPADLSVAVDTSGFSSNPPKMTLQNVDTNTRIFFADAATAPDPAANPPAHFLTPAGWATAELRDPLKTWVWCSPGQRATLAVSEAI